MKRLILILIVFCSCGKEEDINASGTVYSRHNIPMPSSTITAEYARGGKDQTAGAVILVTDKNGFYKFVRKGRVKGQTEVTYFKHTYIMDKDSGYYSVNGFPNAQNYVIHLK